MHGFDRAPMRAKDSVRIVPEAPRSEADTLRSALRADLRSRDERTARLRAMALAAGGEPAE